MKSDNVTSNVNSENSMSGSMSIYPCPTCSGTGTRAGEFSNNQATCTHCNGTGRVTTSPHLLPADEVEQRLASELKHTLKYVPSSQRELFVMELARWYSKDAARREAQAEERGRLAEIDMLIEALKGNYSVVEALQVLRLRQQLTAEEAK